MTKSKTFYLVLAALFTAIGCVLPRLFHTLSLSGQIFLPMHFPVLLCGLICGPTLGGISGILVIFYASVIGGYPPIFPNGIYMACELLAYGFVAGILIKKFNVYVSLIGAMLIGRAVLFVAKLILLSVNKSGFAISTFWADAFITPILGIIIQIIVIPIIVKLIDNYVLKGARA